MLQASLRLAGALNRLAAGTTDAAHAEQWLRLDGTPHHVHDPAQLLGLDPLAAVPVRLALARLANGGQDAQPWALLLPRPGRMAGLRGPAEANRAALDSGAVVVRHDGALAWTGLQVGAGVQWRLWQVERPIPPPDPREAARQLAALLASAAGALDALGVTAGQRPRAASAPQLGAGYPPRSQALLDRAWLLLQAVEQGLDAQAEVLHSHAVLQRERHLRELADACLDATSAAASWPQWALG